ncbi:hypothetical protein CWM52_15570 [Raoultella sp. T31]|nr:hypothetical protein CWM52_15570 [Raoultella sp. T31]
MTLATGSPGERKPDIGILNFQRLCRPGSRRERPNGVLKIVKLWQQASVGETATVDMSAVCEAAA